jgi:hypothetical protein
MSTFHLIKTVNNEELDKFVNQALQKGAYLHGNTFYTGKYYCQAVIYKEKIENLAPRQSQNHTQRIKEHYEDS